MTAKYNETERELLREAKRLGVSLTFARRKTTNVAVLCCAGQVRSIYFAKTPSDRRAVANSIGYLRRFAREMRAEPT